MFNVVSQRGYVSVDGYRKEIAQLKGELARKGQMLESQAKEALEEGEKLRRQIRELQFSAEEGAPRCLACRVCVGLMAMLHANPRASVGVDWNLAGTLEHSKLGKAVLETLAR